MRILLVLIISLSFLQSNCCTTFVLTKNGKITFGRNYDWHIGNGHIFENQRGIKKQAFLLPPENPVVWTSIFGSVTFNQFGKEFPLGGMNEKGLVVEVLWLNSAEFPDPDDRPALNELQWVQYQLDNYSSVAEVIKSDSVIRIGQSFSNIHYLVADFNGNIASIEFIDGKLVYHSGDDMPTACLTNNTYKKSINYIEEKKRKGQSGNINYNSDHSLDRFAQAAEMISKTNTHDPVSYSFEILKQVETKNHTQWSIVYNISDKRIFFKSKSAKQLKYFDLSSFTFDCGSISKMININTSSRGNVQEFFKNYSEQENLKMIKFTISEMPFLTDLPEEFIISLAKYPAKLECPN